MKITLANLHEATAQQVFDQVATHLLTQNEKSVDRTERGPECVYRSYKGLQCAAGCLISEHEYNPGMENNQWDDLAHSGIVPSDHKELIMELQCVHDTELAYNWEHSLEKVANKTGLTFDKEKYLNSGNAENA